MHRILICGMDWRSELTWNQSPTCSLLLVKVHITRSKHKHPGSVRWRLKGDFFLSLPAPCSGHHFHAVGIIEIKGGWGGINSCKCLCCLQGWQVLAISWCICYPCQFILLSNGVWSQCCNLQTKYFLDLWSRVLNWPIVMLNWLIIVHILTERWH